MMPYRYLVMCMTKKKKRIDWIGEINEAVLEAIRTNPKWRFPTIRSMFYYLSDALNIIPATERGYKQLDHLTVQMRKDEEIAFGYFKVERGVSKTTRSFLPPEFKIKMAFEYLLEAPEKYKIPLLYNQLYLVEVWCEKKGLIPTFEHLVGDQVTIRSPEGFSPWEFANDTIKNMQDIYFDERENEKVIIEYFGDQDPSGIQIYESIKEQMEYFGIDYEMHRIGVNLDQIRTLNLPTSPKDAEAKERLLRDPRYERYIQKYGKVFCELDSFISLAPEEFKRTLEQAVSGHVDTDILEERATLNNDLKGRFTRIIEANKNEIEKLRKRLEKAYEDSE